MILIELLILIVGSILFIDGLKNIEQGEPGFGEAMFGSVLLISLFVVYIDDPINRSYILNILQFKIF